MNTTLRRISAAAVLAATLGLGACGNSSSGTTSGGSPSVSTTVAASSDASTNPVGTPSSAPTTSEAATSSASTASVSAPPASAATPSTSADESEPDDSLISYTAMGGMRIGTPAADLVAQGLAKKSSTCEKSWDHALAPKDYQLAFEDEKLEGVWTRDPRTHTEEGARIGMTFAQLEELFGKGYILRPMSFDGDGKVEVAQVTDGERAIYFGAVDSAGEWTDAKPTSKVAWMATQRYSNSFVFGC